MADAEDPFGNAVARLQTAAGLFEAVKALRKQAKGSRAGMPASCGPVFRSALAEKIEWFADAWQSVGSLIDLIDLEELEYKAGRLIELLEDPSSQIWKPETEWPLYVRDIFEAVAGMELKLWDVWQRAQRMFDEWAGIAQMRMDDGGKLVIEFRGAAAEVSEVSAADEEANSPAAPEAGSKFARATDKVPELYRENGRPCGPLTGNATALLRAITQRPDPRPEKLKRLHGGQVWVRKTAEREFEVFFRTFKEFHEAEERLKPSEKPDNGG
jgi:hypothetical protein